MNNLSIKQGENVAKHGVYRLLLLGGVKLVAGLLTGMTVMIADAISTFADSLGMFAAYLGLRLSRKSANKNFSYGYYKIETVAALIISIWIIILGIIIFRESIDLFYETKIGQHRAFAITTTIFAIYNTYHLEKRLREAAKKCNSLALRASAEDKKMDMFAGIAILISIVANYQQIPYVEALVSTGLALIILKAGVSSAKESLFFLLDYWNDPALQKNIKSILKKEKELIHNVKKIRLRRAGTFIFGEAFVEINPFIGMEDLRESLKILQDKIKALNPYIKDFSIYTHISKAKKTKIAIPLSKGETLDTGQVASSLPSTHGYLFVELSQNKIKKTYYKPLTKNHKAIVELADFIKAEKTNLVIDNRLNSIVYFNLRHTHQILIYPNFSDIKDARQALELILIDS